MTLPEITCDHCGTPAPSLEEIRERGKGGGLIAMGWHCTGGKRVCPDCREDKEKEAA